jgi:two-component system, chemotaxis family, CheB/CheR fusion protein
MKKKRVDGRSWRVLVVDDNPDGAEMLDMVLRIKGAETRVARDGAAAIAALARFRPDVIVADAHMPGMDGAEMAALIRDDDGNRDVLLIALTGDSRAKFEAQLLAAGFDRYLLKPVIIDDLWRMIEAHCAGVSAGTA